MYDIPTADVRKIEAELFGAPSERYAAFYLHAQYDETASTEAGFPIYRDVPYCLIRLKGEKDNISHPACEADRNEFPREWALFERSLTREEHPVQLLPKITPSVVAALRDLKVHTIEQLAEANVPEPYMPWKSLAVRWRAFWNKPRMKLVDGKFVEAA